MESILAKIQYLIDLTRHLVPILLRILSGPRLEWIEQLAEEVHQA